MTGYQLSPIPEVETHVPLTPEARTAFTEMWRAIEEAAKTDCEKFPHLGTPPPVLTAEEIDQLRLLMESPYADPVHVSNCVAPLALYRGREGIWFQKANSAFAKRTDVQLIHVVRLAMLVEWRNPWWQSKWLDRLATDYYFVDRSRFSLRHLSAVLEAMGQDAHAVGELYFQPGSLFLMNIGDENIWPYFAEHQDLLDDLWHRTNPNVRLMEALKERVYQVLGMMPQMPAQFDAYCWEAAFKGNRKERPLAQAALHNDSKLVQRVGEVLAGKKADQRAIAAEWLGRLGNKDAIPPLKAALEKEKQDAAAREMVAALEKLGVQLGELAAVAEPDAAAEATSAKGMLSALSSQAERAPQVAAATLPPLPEIETEVPLTPEAALALGAVWREACSEQARQHEGNPKLYGEPPALTAADVIEVQRAIESGMPADMSGMPCLKALGELGLRLQQPAVAWVGRADVSLIHALRLSQVVSAGQPWYALSCVQEFSSRYNATHRPQFTLRELAAALHAIGREEKDVAEMILIRPFAWNPPFFRLGPEGIWPYFAEHEEYLDSALNYSDKSAAAAAEIRSRAFNVLAMFPALPQHFVRMCWDIVLNGSKKERPLAQAALRNSQGKEAHLMEALSAKKPEPRTIAAEWLGRLGAAEAIPGLKKSLAVEKDDLAAGEMMIALERLGVPLEEFVSLDGLLKEANALLGKGIPKELAWFNLGALPKMRWAKGNEPVRQEIAQWMVLQSHKLNNPEPGPRLRQYVSYLNKGDAEELGQYVLEAWIARDTTPHTHDEADAYAQQYAAQMVSYGYYPNKTREDYYREAYNKKITEPSGSAIKEKGILAVAGACCGSRAAVPVERFLKTYHGYRVHQSKALVQMLSWVDQPNAIQVLLAVASRFRTPAIRQEAEKCVTIIADRKQWTVDELADRTIPTAGFDENLELSLDYGPRQFIARLGAEFNVVLADEDGKPIKALPPTRQGDDADKAKAAKVDLATAKKDIGGLLKMQEQRLYEAMCIQRSWRFADWDLFLNNHPIVRLYCQRLVWGVLEDGNVTRTFRPLADGSLTDAGDAPIQIAPDERVVLAHARTVPNEQAQAWQRHYTDYQVAPLFSQFGTPYILPKEKGEETELNDFLGHTLEAFKLRGCLIKLGYSRGAAEDGGMFSTYHKGFPGLSLTAIIGFSGNILPEENRTVALQSLYFLRGSDASKYGGEHVPLGQIPPVLLSEIRGDMRTAAAQGAGFDPEWRKKAEF